MRQLPGQPRVALPRWLKSVITGAITVMATIWFLSLLPFLLLATLLLSFLLIPTIRHLRREMEEAGLKMNEPLKSKRQRDVNITPWHRQIRNAWRDFSS